MIVSTSGIFTKSVELDSGWRVNHLELLRPDRPSTAARQTCLARRLNREPRATAARVTLPIATTTLRIRFAPSRRLAPDDQRELEFKVFVAGAICIGLGLTPFIARAQAATTVVELVGDLRRSKPGTWAPI